MNYRITSELSEKAKQILLNDEINETLNVLKNQISFLENGELNNTTFSDEENKTIKSNIVNLNSGLDILSFQKETLLSGMENCFEQMNIKEAVNLKTKLREVENKIGEVNKEKNKLEEKFALGRNDFQVQLLEIREKYDGEDIDINNFSDINFSKSVINQYKKERVSKLINNFLNSLTREKQEEILNNNEDLRGLVNVGENI